MDSLQRWCANQSVGPFEAERAHLDLAIETIRDLGSVAVLGSRAETTVRVAHYVESLGVTGPSAVLGTDRRVDPVSAALLNGAAAQAYDFDDIAPACVSHVSSIMVPALLALAHDAEPELLLHGYVRGLGVIGRLAESFTHEVYDRGIQPTHTTGPIGATTALIHALGLTPDEALAAFGLLATQLIGLRSHTGTGYKPVQAGVAASAAVRSVLLARAGVTAGDDALDIVMALIGIRPEELAALTRSETLVPVALATKWYPTCGAAHTSIEAAIELRSRLGDAAEHRAAHLRVTVPPRVMEALEFHRPTTPDEARFSMEYCVATAWQTGAVTPADFATPAIERDEVAEMMGRVEVVLDDALTPPPTWSGFPSIVEARSDAGDLLGHARVERPAGYPERPLSAEQRRSKFVACVEPVLGTSVAEAFDRLSGDDIFSALGAELAMHGPESNR